MFPLPYDQVIPLPKPDKNVNRQDHYWPTGLIPVPQRRHRKQLIHRKQKLLRLLPVSGMPSLLPPANGKHMATIIDPKEIGGLLRSISDYQGSIVTRCALRLAPLVFVRPGELRKAEWRISAEKMKAGVPHIVPLPRQA
jgi:integrase